MFSPCNIGINLPKYSLVFLANHLVFTCIIVKLHFATLLSYNITSHTQFFNGCFGQLCNTYIRVLKCHYCINQLCHICILTCFSNSKFIYMQILHVLCLTCSFGITFWGQGPPKVSLDQQNVLKFHSTLNALIFAIPLLTIIITFHGT
jgi:hypothetical protein